MATKLNPDYCIPYGALTIVPNAYNGEAGYLRVRIERGAVVKVYYPNIQDEDGSRPLDYAVDATSYRTWVLTARDTALGDPMSTYYIYLRLGTDGAALVTFSLISPNSKFATCGKWNGIEWTPKKDEQGNWWVHIGVLEYHADQRAHTLEVDMGELGTPRGDNNRTDNEALSYDTEQHLITLRDGWRFLDLRVDGNVSADSVSVNRVTLGGETVNKVLNGPFVDSEGNQQQGDSEEDNSNASLVTSGWLRGSWVNWLLALLRGLFLRRDVNERTHFDFTAKNLISEHDVSTTDAYVSGHTQTGTLEVEQNASVGEDIEVEKEARVGGSIHVGNDAEINGNAVVVGKVTSNQFRTPAYEEGDTFLGKGASVYQDAGNNGHVDTDYLAVRKAALFREVTISEVKHIGGELILSAASCRLDYVDEQSVAYKDYTDPLSGRVYHEIFAYRCYFAKVVNGETIYNEWMVGDMARCQVCGLKPGTSENVATKYYWRAVVGMGESEDGQFHYIDLATSVGLRDVVGYPGYGEEGVQQASSIPEAGDSVVLLGSRSGVSSRTSAQVMSTVGTHAPSRTYYHNITSFKLDDSMVVETMDWNIDRSHAHWRVGNNAGGYIDFGPDGLNIKASKLYMGSTGNKDMFEEFDRLEGDLIGATQETVEIYMLDANEDKTLEKPAPRLDDDGQTVIASGYDFGWAEPVAHLGAVCIAPDGLCWKWEQTGEASFVWRIVTDKYLIQSYESAASAMQTQRHSVYTTWKKQCEQFQSVYKLMDMLLKGSSKYSSVNPTTNQRELTTEGAALENAMSALQGANAHVYAEFASVFGKNIEEVTNEDLVSSEPIVFSSNFESKYNAYIEKLQTANALINEFQGWVNQQTDEFTKIGNRWFAKNEQGEYELQESLLQIQKDYSALTNKYFEKNEKTGEYTTKEGGLVTSSNYATLFAQQATKNKVVNMATMNVAIKNGISSANIQASQIQLTGFISANNNLFIDQDANLFAEQGVFGGMLRENYTVVCNGNRSRYGYDKYYLAHNDAGGSTKNWWYSVDIRKTGPNVLLYAASGSEATEDLHGYENRTTLYATLGANVEVNLPCYVYQQTEGWNEARNLIEARKYLGRTVRIKVLDSGVNKLMLYGSVIASASNGKHYRSSLNQTYTSPSSRGILECTCKAVRLCNTGGNEESVYSIVWEVVEKDEFHQITEGGHRVLFLPFYHWEPDLIMYATSGVLTPDHKYDLYQQWMRIQARHLSMSKDSRYTSAEMRAGSLWQKLEQDYAELQTAVNGTSANGGYLCQTDAGDAYEGLFLHIQFATVLEYEDGSNGADDLADAFSHYYTTLDSLESLVNEA